MLNWNGDSLKSANNLHFVQSAPLCQSQSQFGKGCQRIGDAKFFWRKYSNHFDRIRFVSRRSNQHVHVSIFYMILLFQLMCLFCFLLLKSTATNSSNVPFLFAKVAVCVLNLHLIASCAPPPHLKHAFFCFDVLCHVVLFHCSLIFCTACTVSLTCLAAWRSLELFLAASIVCASWNAFWNVRSFSASSFC